MLLVLETGTFSTLKAKVGLSLFDRILFPDEIYSAPDSAKKVRAIRCNYYVCAMPMWACECEFCARKGAFYQLVFCLKVCVHSCMRARVLTM